MRQRPRTGAIVVVCATAIMASSCASKPKVRAATDPVTVSSIQKSADAASKNDAESTGVGGPLGDSAVEAGSGAPLTLGTAVQKAVSWHPSVVEAVNRIGQQNEVLNEARSGYFPRISWGVNSSYESVQSEGYRPALNVTASQMIYDFGKVDGTARIATAGIANRKSQMLMAIDDLIRETSYAVIEVWRNDALRAVALDQMRDTSAILKLVGARTDTGASTRSDRLQAEARVQAAEATALEIQAQARRWASVLANLTGSTRGMGPRVETPKWLATACNSAQPDWSRIPGIIQANAEHAAAVAQLGLSRAEGLPTLSLDVGTGVDLMRIGSRDPDYTIGLNVAGSLYNGGESGARRNAAQYALQSSQASRSKVKVNIARSLAEANAQVDSMRLLSGSLSKRQEMMKETRDLYRTQYLELGTRTLLDLLNADQEMHAARFDKINIDHDLQRLGIDCAFNSGRLRENFSLEGKLLHGVAL